MHHQSQFMRCERVARWVGEEEGRGGGGGGGGSLLLVVGEGKCIN